MRPLAEPEAACAAPSPGGITIPSAGPVVHWRQAILVLFLCLGRLGSAAPPPVSPPLPLRAAVPLLCTENMALRTRLRGTGLIADSGGTLLTAAHVILQARSNCTLSVMIPDDEWTRLGHLRRFQLAGCHVNESLDIAVCRLQPADSARDWAYLRAAPIRFRPAVPGEPVWVTSFTGWALVPLTRNGHLTGRQDYRRQDGCRCDFATDIVAVEGMSGSPVISNDGEVLGILTQAGNGKFRGTSFGVSFDTARGFLAAQGIPVSSSPRAAGQDRPAPRQLAADSAETPLALPIARSRKDSPDFADPHAKASTVEDLWWS